MDREQITELVTELEKALADEYFVKRHAAQLQRGVEVCKAILLSDSYKNGTIDGKNADIRKRQETVLLNRNEDYQDGLKALVEAEQNAAMAEIKRKAVDATVGLTKAWLYSQSGR